MSSLVLAHGAPQLKLVHTEFGLKKTAVASAVASILATSRGYIVKAGDEAIANEV